jgi:hypothetical protein
MREGSLAEMEQRVQIHSNQMRILNDQYAAKLAANDLQAFKFKRLMRSRKRWRRGFDGWPLRFGVKGQVVQTPRYR